MCPSTDELMAKAEWDGAHGKSRHVLLSELSSMLAGYMETRKAVQISRIEIMVLS
jgi:hypothetical protein